MTEFKPGDRVRIKDNYPIHRADFAPSDAAMRGETGTITDISRWVGFNIEVKRDSESFGSHSYFYPEELELL